MREILFVVGLALCASPASAEYIPPSRITLQTATHAPARIAVTPGIYNYSIRWQGIPVATAEIQVGTDGPIAYAVAAVKTAQVMDLLYRLRHRSEAVFRMAPFQPIRYAFAQTENSKERSRDVQFGSNGSVVARLWKPGAEPEEVAFSPGNLTLDPISAAFLARSLPINPGSKVDLDVFNGKHRFLITFHVGEIERAKVNGRSVQAFRVTPEVTRLTDTKPEKRLQSATLWISADDKREVLKLESKVWIGSVTATLVSQILGEPTTPPLTSAKLGGESELRR